MTMYARELNDDYAKNEDPPALNIGGYYTSDDDDDSIFWLI